MCLFTYEADHDHDLIVWRIEGTQQASSHAVVATLPSWCKDMTKAAWRPLDGAVALRIGISIAMIVIPQTARKVAESTNPARIVRSGKMAGRWLGFAVEPWLGDGRRDREQAVASPRRGAAAKQAVQQVVVVRLDIFSECPAYSVDLVVIGQQAGASPGGGGLERLPPLREFRGPRTAAPASSGVSCPFGARFSRVSGEGRTAETSGWRRLLVIREPCQRLQGRLMRRFEWHAGAAQAAGPPVQWQGSCTSTDGERRRLRGDGSCPGVFGHFRETLILAMGSGTDIRCSANTTSHHPRGWRRAKCARGRLKPQRSGSGQRPRHHRKRGGRGVLPVQEGVWRFSETT